MFFPARNKLISLYCIHLKTYTRIAEWNDENNHDPNLLNENRTFPRIVENSGNKRGQERRLKHNPQSRVGSRGLGWGL